MLKFWRREVWTIAGTQFLVVDGSCNCSKKYQEYWYQTQYQSNKYWDQTLES